MKNSFRPLRREVDRDDAAFRDLSFCLYSGQSTRTRSAEARILCLADRAGARNMAHASWAEVIALDATP
jgi:hypothetical protein